MDAFVHRSQLVMTNDVAPLHVVALFGALMGDVAQENHTVTRLGVDNIMLLRFAPSFKFGGDQRDRGAGVPFDVRSSRT